MIKMETKYTPLPLTTDTEAETSFDLEKSFKDVSKKPENPTKRRSLFNVTVEKIKSPEEGRKSEQFKSAEILTKKEVREWHALYCEIKRDLKKAKEKHPLIDISILPEDKREFILQEPDMDRYLRDLHEFQCKASRFMENEFVDMVELRKNLSDLCKHKIQVAKQMKLNELHCSDDIV